VRLARSIPAILSAALIAAHFLRSGQYPLVVVSLAFPLLLLARKAWAVWIVQLLLVLAAVEWIRTTVQLVAERRVAGQSFTGAVIILAVVALLTIASALLLEPAKGKEEEG